MNKHYPRDFVLGLFLFVRHLQLSIHRASIAEWPELRRYIHCRTEPKEVISYISEVTGINPPSSPTSKIEEVHKGKEIGEAKFALGSQDLLGIMHWLQVASRILVQDSPSSAEIGLARLELARYEQKLASLLSTNDRKISNVEHFNQNSILRCESIKSLLGAPWP